MSQTTRSPDRRAASTSARAETLEPRRLLSAALLKEIGDGWGSSAGWFVPYKGALYYAASDTRGQELYRSAGPGSPVELVRDIIPGSAGSTPRNLTVVGDTLYFTAQTDAAGVELWKTDGTAVGTVMVNDLVPGPAGSHPDQLTELNGKLLFRSDVLWASDGTAAGTAPFFDPLPSYHGGSVGSILAVGGAAYFTTPTLVGDTRRLWKTDGTPAGTEVVREFGVRSRSDQNQVWGLTALDARRFVIVTGGTGDYASYGCELWVSDGTAAGTARLKSFNPFNTIDGNIFRLVNLDGTVYFAAEGPTTSAGRAGVELWKTDGTPDGTVQVADINPGTAGSMPWLLGGGNGRLLFNAADAFNSTPRLWVTDGTATGTRQLPLPSSAGPGSAATVSGETLLFTTQYALWASDGTAAGTSVLRAFNGAATPGGFIPFRGGFVFWADDRRWGHETWFTDGTPQGTVILADVHPHMFGFTTGWPGLTEPVTLAGGRTLFAGGGAGDVKLWTTDGTPAGTTSVPGFSVATVSALKPGRDASGPFAYVSTGNNSAAAQLWRADAAGAVPLGTAAIAGDSVTRADGTLLYAGQAPRGNHGVELYKSNGTAAGTSLVKDILFSGSSSQPANFTDVNGTVYFTTGQGALLWKTDGTSAGTVTVKDLALGSAANTYPTLAALGGRLYFTFNGADGRRQLWKTDGTASGTVMVTHVGAIGERMMQYNGRLYFTAAPADGSSGYELWRTDGTAGGTTLVRDILPGPEGSQPEDLRTAGGRIYFSAVDRTGARGLWSSDGTGAGTAKVFGLVDGDGVPSVGVTRLWGERNGRVYFTARDNAHGLELWSTDGTAAGTFMVEDVRRGPGDSDASSPAEAGERVIFFASDAAHGYQPRVVLSPRPTPYVTARHVFYNNSALDGRDPAATAADDDAIAAGKQLLVATAVVSEPQNYTTDSRGINGLMIDVDNLPPAAAPTGADFQFHVGDGSGWTPLAAGPAVAVRRGAGASGSDRITLTFPDGLVRNTWLRVTVKANAGTGLAAPDVFYFGNLAGDTGGPGTPIVNTLDYARTRAAVGRTAATALNAFDFNRDGRINALDVGIVRANQRRSLALFAAPAAPATPSAAAAGEAFDVVPPSSRPARLPARRSAWDVIAGEA